MSATARFSNPAYRQLIERIADEAPDSGWPEDVDLLASITPLSDEEVAVACDLHRQALADELALDSTIIGGYLRREIDSNTLLNMLRDVTERAVCQVIRSDVMTELQERTELANERDLGQCYGAGAAFTLREQVARNYAVSRLK